jgi:hypothetical protein
MFQHPQNGILHGTSRNYSILLWGLAVLFAARVAGQALQLCLPQSFLPPFHAFQGSNLPYALLLAAQLAILALMAVTGWRVYRGTLVRFRLPPYFWYPSLLGGAIAALCTPIQERRTRRPQEFRFRSSITR